MNHYKNIMTSPKLITHVSEQSTMHQVANTPNILYSSLHSTVSLQFSWWGLTHTTSADPR